ncbi:polysaccharide deacetylase family protein [Rheinheimera sp. UJ63]|uniref:polysaccharide deacetylase family protein n=1 Tax=Rheinheimera sp. UJ63 TaxID=2910157 RepID=UPI001F35988E|nr:polysaccharide deacetylase family protein [Rheinheimera sp. UJ63]MCF4007814.1 polysaccharide deacetylase family protein [Rheinheimera sp. UJ63]
MFTNKQSIHLPVSMPPQLMVVIDTEEEFNWNEFPDRKKTSVAHLNQLDRVQSIFDEYGIKPCYVVDYPIASDKQNNKSLRDIFAAGRCEIGAHLHPWVTPPLSEELSIANMYPGNLSAELEYAKLVALVAKIEETFLFKPSVYKAGRYGFGPNTQAIITQLGFEIDVSVCPVFDHRADGGPDYRAYNSEPFWFGNQLLELPVTVALTGWARGLADPLFRNAQRLKKIKGPGILSKLGAVDRLVLSPEGYTPAEHKKLTQELLTRGTRLFIWSFHSPNVEVGHTPYVQNERELQQFLDSFRRYFDYFFGELAGTATSPCQFKKLIEK